MIDIMQLNDEANKALKTNKNTINASIGMYYNEDKKLLSLKTIKEGLDKLDPETYLAYNTVTGGKEFQNNIINWVFGDSLSLIPNNVLIKAVATPGGSGAISSLFNIYGKDGDYILVSDIRWQYERFSKAAGLNILEHKLFDDNNTFNLKDFEEKLHYLTKTQEKVIVVLNDPCHNPTGYSMTNKELSNVVDIINSFTNNKIILLYDLAYLDFETDLNVREKLVILSNLGKSKLCVLAFSGSKTMGLYGLRIGSAIAYGKDSAFVSDFYEKIKAHSVGSWSTTSSLGIELINYVLSKNNTSLFKNDLTLVRDTMKQRSKIFINELKLANIETYPYKSGFYVLIKSSNPLEDFKKLKTHNLFLVPLKEGLRVALCSININEIKGLAQKIKDALNS